MCPDFRYMRPVQVARLQNLFRSLAQIRLLAISVRSSPAAGRCWIRQSLQVAHLEAISCLTAVDGWWWSCVEGWQKAGIGTTSLKLEYSVKRILKDAMVAMCCPWSYVKTSIFAFTLFSTGCIILMGVTVLTLYPLPSDQSFLSAVRLLHVSDQPDSRTRVGNRRPVSQIAKSGSCINSKKPLNNCNGD